MSLLSKRTFARAKDALLLPGSLVTAHRLRVQAAGLGSVSVEGLKRIHGGAGQRETDEHFVGRFGVCCARSIAPIVDPAEEFDPVPAALLSRYSSGRHLLLDLIAGAGAASLGHLLAIAEARASDSLPRLPVELDVVAADYSSHALSHCTDLYARSQDAFNQANMKVTLMTHEWDATNEVQTSRMLHETTPPYNSIILLSSNFSGAFGSAEQLPRVRGTIHFVNTYLAGTGKHYCSLWVEPATPGISSKKKKSSGVGRVFSMLSELFERIRADLGRAEQTPAPFIEANLQFVDNLLEHRKAEVRPCRVGFQWFETPLGDDIDTALE